MAQAVVKLTKPCEPYGCRATGRGVVWGIQGNTHTDSHVHLRKPVPSEVQGSIVNEAFMDGLPDHLVNWRMVRVRGATEFWIGETEVAWEVFECWALSLDLSQEEQVLGVDAVCRPSKPYATIFANFGHHGYPAICISFKNALGFCEWLCEKTGRAYRLPTEDEWERACVFADGAIDLDTHAWHWENADDTTHPVGTKSPNKLGLFDILGNAAEWCVAGDGSGVLRGGSWRTKAADLNPGNRQPDDPRWNEGDPQNPKSVWWLANGQFAGMRLACDVSDLHPDG